MTKSKKIIAKVAKFAAEKSLSRDANSTTCIALHEASDQINILIHHHKLKFS